MIAYSNDVTFHIVSNTISLYYFLSMIQERASPLHIASQEGHDDVVQLLLNGGARIDLIAKVYYNFYSNRSHSYY